MAPCPTQRLDALIVQHPEEPTLAEHGMMNEGPLARALGAWPAPRRRRDDHGRAFRVCSSSLASAAVSRMSTFGRAAIRSAKARRRPPAIPPHYLA
jgi:dihydroorotase-like cyclic amidohydrolase